MADVVYDERAENKVIRREDSAEDGVQDNELLDTDVSNDVRIPREENDQTFLWITSLGRSRNISTANGRQSFAQNVVAMNSENSITDINGSKLVRVAGPSFFGVATKQAKNIKSYRERNFMLETELTEMRDIANNKEAFIKKIADDALQKKTIIKTLTLEIQE